MTSKKRGCPKTQPLFYFYISKIVLISIYFNNIPKLMPEVNVNGKSQLFKNEWL
jgi:hypothetical protein